MLSLQKQLDLQRLHRISDDLSELSRVAIDMRRRGVRLDEAAREAHRHSLVSARQQIADLWNAKWGADYPLGENGASPRLKKLFFDRFGLAPLRLSNITGKPKLDTWTLQMFRAKGGDIAEAAAWILEYRKNTKLLTTYIEGVLSGPDGRVHPAWSVWGPITGRWACSEPNLMNIPKEKELKLGPRTVKLPSMRDMVVAAPGNVFVAADYEKLELWIVAALSGDKPLIEAWRTGVDVHTQNARDMFKREPDANQRHFAKRFVYGANYDAMPETLWAAMVTEFPETQLPHVRRLLMAWKNAHPAIFQMHHRWRKFVYENGYIEIPVIGKRVYYPDEKQTVNIPVQGTAAVLANRAVRTIAERDRAHWLVIQCHDELVLEVPEADVPKAAQLLRDAMTAPLELNGAQWVFPIDLKYGHNWGAMQKLKGV